MANGFYAGYDDVWILDGVRTPVATGARIVLGGRSFTVTVAPGR